jgi:hypothetical protein
MSITPVTYSFAGKSRSTSFVLAYLIMMRGMKLKESLDLVRLTRPLAEPNAGFLLQLKAFEKAVHGSVSTGLPIFKKKVAEDSLKTQEEEKVEQSPPDVVTVQKVKTSEKKEIEDGIEQMKIQGDQEGAEEMEDKLS